MSFKKLEIVSRNKFDVMFSFKFKQDIKKKPCCHGDTQDVHDHGFVATIVLRLQTTLTAFRMT